MSILDGVGFQFDESMSGFLGVGETDPEEGVMLGRRAETPMRFDVKIDVEDLARFLNVSEHESKLTGTVTFAPLGGTFDIFDGTFNLFSVDAKLGIRTMVYAFKFVAGDGKTYTFHGHKKIHDDPGKVDVVEDMTHLFSVLYEGEDDTGRVHGAGLLYFHLKDSWDLVSSMKVTHAKWPWTEIAAKLAFASFAWGALRNTYLHNELPTFETEYANLSLAGRLKGEGGADVDFFLVSGAHDKDFPWGDTECFWDVLLVVGDAAGGYRRFCLTDRVLEGMELDVEGGSWRYRGPLFELTDGYSSSFTAMRGEAAEHLAPVQADLELSFVTKRFDAVPVPFPSMPRLLRKLMSRLARDFEEVLPSEHLLGLSCAPHSVTVTQGRFALTPADAASPALALTVTPDASFGEAEVATLKWFKEPTLLYGYVCALQPDRQTSRTQIHTATLRDERQHWAEDRVDALIGSAFTEIGSGEILIADGKQTVTNLAEEFRGEGKRERLLVKLGDPLLEVRNDHFPTAEFLRRIIRVRDPEGRECLALEEAMDTLEREPIDSEETVTVAAVRDEDKVAALDAVLAKTGFADVLEQAFTASGKERKGDFSIAIKPNFMFSYNVNDHTSYTDPELFMHLVERIRAQGFERIYLVEAHSTYGEYFDRRDVKSMADYLGFHPEGKYEVVDLTEGATDEMRFGQILGTHPVCPIWRDADFRISFAKNKTHAYAYYTLTLKNIYGALPMANKFKEYHCARDIYHTAIEYLEALPVHFGLVDATVSADGPFGVFADPGPNVTNTVIGSRNLVATDWVAASKMGIDPRISKYMQLAVKAFGKPRIALVGDGDVYAPWLNVPTAMTLLTHGAVDASYFFGNLFYMSAAQMDETHFNVKRRGWFVRTLRKLTVPLRRAFFVRTGRNPNWLNRFFCWLFYKMGF